MKAILHSIEAFIAIMILVTLTSFIFTRPTTTPEIARLNYKLSAYNGLKLLEESGELREYTLKNNATGIESLLSSFIPYFLSYSVVIYNSTSNLTAIPTITANNTIVVNYFIAGSSGNYSAREIVIYMWGFD